MNLNISNRSLPLLLVAVSAGLSGAALAQTTPADSSAAAGSSQGLGQTTTDSSMIGSRSTAVQNEPVLMAQAPGSAGVGRSGYARADGYSLLPFTRSGYWGINVGRPVFRSGCGNGAYGCDNPNAGVSIYTGGLINEVVGMELGYMYTGKASRAGGDTRAQGVSLSLVGRMPIGAFNAFVKGGALYSETKVSTGVLSDVPSGKRRGLGGVYGAGVGFDFTPSSGIVAEWSRKELRFPGIGGRENVDTTSLGYVHRF